MRPQLRPVAEQQVVVVATAEQPDATSPISDADITAALREAVKTPAPQVRAPPAEITLASTNATLRPTIRPKPVAAVRTKKKSVEQEIVTRVSTSGGRHWGVNIGRYPSRFAAEKVLLTTALTEMSSLDGTLRKVVQRPQGFDANFLGMTRESADLACRRLAARNVSCFMIGPG